MSDTISAPSDTESEKVSYDTGLPCNKAEQLNTILCNFQSNLLRSVDEKLSAVNIKLSNTVSKLNNSDNPVKTFAEMAAKKECKF